MNDSDLQTVLRAARFAAEFHRGQLRKDGGAPYINHPIEVACLLSQHGADLTTVVAGLLHDTVEDTEATFADVEREFGSEVCGVVREVTDDKSLEKSTRKQLQVETAPHKSLRAKQLKLADKACNLRNMANAQPRGWSRERIEQYFDWCDRVVAGLRGAHPGLESCYDEAAQAGRAALHLPPRP